MIDLRLPIGIFFLLVGLLMAGYGVVSPNDIPHIGMKINGNLDWGIVLTIFGLLMTIFGWRGQRRPPERKNQQPPTH